MGRDRRKWFTWIFVMLTVGIVAIMMTGTLRRPEHITLPSLEETSGDVTGELAGNETLTLIEVTPETVQTAIATLERPDEYHRTVVVERFWTGGSGSSQSMVTVSRGWTRVDRILPNGQVRHAVTNGEVTHIWYDQDKTVYTTPAGEISADNEQIIPTYEDVLALDTSTIVAADYRLESERQCIYVETAEDADGYVRRYWVDLESGLLAMAETMQHGEIVYRMGAMQEETVADRVASFTLPDGTLLLNETITE